MYSITELLFIQFMFFMILFKSKTTFLYLYNLLYYDTIYNVNKEGSIKNDETHIITKTEPKYEDKYLEKFKQMPNEFIFTNYELEQEKEEYIKIRLDYEKSRFNTINTIQEKLTKISEIKKFTLDFTNDFLIKQLITFFNIEQQYKEDPDEFDIEELYNNLTEHNTQLLKQMDEAEQMVMTDDEIHKQARDEMINTKLNNCINNYVMEYTPLGNIYMRYNNDKKSFEYFSNKSIPYRYLEPVGRKYVLTYCCKPIFIDIEEELKKAEIKFDDETKKKEENKKNNTKNIFAQFKNYNNNTSKQSTSKPIKNRTNTSTVLPPQIKANLPDVHIQTEKQILKENANRYTWEGRLTNLNLLKKIHRQKFDKNLTLSYSDFKKMLQEQQK